MSPKQRSRGASRRYSLSVELLEGRDLMSVIPIILNLGRVPAHGNSAASAGSPAAAPTGGSSSNLGQPTPHEVARQRFVAKLSGSYITGPGRFTNQALQAFILATGGSNQSLRMNEQMRFFVPANPTADNPTTGVTALSAKNVSSSGNTLILDLTALPQAGFRGLPTQFTWTVDPSSGGVWQQAGGFGTGQGTLTVNYIPTTRIPHGATGAGRINLFFQGSINTSQVTLDLGAPGNRPGPP